MSRAYFKTKAIADLFTVWCFNAGKYVELCGRGSGWVVTWE